MSELSDLRKISLSFRRVSSNLLNSDRDNAEVNLIRFINYIDETPLLHKIIWDAINGIEFNFEECFITSDYGRLDIKIPVDEKKHLKAQYDYAKAMIDSESRTVHSETMKAYRGISDDKYQAFLTDSLKPMIDYINDQISMEMILAEDSAKPIPLVQNFGDNYGTFNNQSSGTINSQNILNMNKDILHLLDRIIASLDSIEDVPQEDIDDVKDDLESITEQINSTMPKKSRLQKALNGIKKFASDFAMKLGVSLATGAVTTMDWSQFIDLIENYIKNIR